jgi:hypothetical protein
MDLKKLVLTEMHNPDLYLEVIKNVERNLKYSVDIACKNHWSINDWKLDESFSGKDGKTQLTSFITARLFDLWEDAIIEVMNTRLNHINMKIKVEHNPSQKGDMIIIISKKYKEIWEIKSSQTKDAFTGSIHSTGKEKRFTNYILINYCINRNKKMTLGKNKEIINEAAVFVGKIKLGRFSKENSTNSCISLKIPLREANKLTPVIGELIISH